MIGQRRSLRRSKPSSSITLSAWWLQTTAAKTSLLLSVKTGNYRVEIRTTVSVLQVLDQTKYLSVNYNDIIVYVPTAAAAAGDDEDEDAGGGGGV